VARYLSGGYGVAPVAGVRYDVGSRTYVYVRGLYRVVDSGTGSSTVQPLVTSVDANNEATAGKGVRVGLERQERDASFNAEVSQHRVNEAVRAFFEGDFLTDFDSVYVFDGNTVRQYKLGGSHRLSESLSGNVALRYGTVAGDPAAQSAAAYGIVQNDGRFWSARAAVEVVPSGTGVAVLVRGVRQSLATLASSHSNDSRRLAVSVAQNLSFVGLNPFGSVCKLLLALERAQSASLASGEDAPSANRLLGGVAISF
jgi:hypothetical protein